MSAKIKHQLLKQLEEQSKRVLVELLKTKDIDLNKEKELQLALQRLLDTHFQAKIVQSEYVAFD